MEKKKNGQNCSLTTGNNQKNELGLSTLWAGENLTDSEVQILEHVDRERLLSKQQIQKVLAKKRKEPQLQIIQILFKNQWLNTQECVRFVTESSKDLVENSLEADLTEKANAQNTSPAPKKVRKVKTIGDYLLLKKLGQGGMSIVYKAAHKTTKKTVALKILISGQAARNDEKQRFHKEINAMKRLDHENIVKIHDIGEAKGITYYTMDYINGQSLKEAGGKISFKKAAAIMEKVCRGMQHAHDLNIIHRDLKPENILLDRKGNPYITDFGLAKDISEYSSLTNTGACIGTPLFMSPEQARGKSKDATFLSDVYSLGATLYHLLTGKPPFVRESLVELLNAIVREQPRFPSTLRATIPQQADWIVLWAMEKEIAQRCPSAQAMADDLRACIQGQPLKAKPRQPSRLPAWIFDKQVMISALVLLFGLCYFLIAFRRIENSQTNGKKNIAEKNRNTVVPITKKKGKEETDIIVKVRETTLEATEESQKQEAQQELDIIENEDWRKQNSKKIAAYRRLILKYPKTPAANKAKRYAEKLQYTLEKMARHAAKRVIAKSKRALQNMSLAEAHRELLDFPEYLEKTVAGRDILQRQQMMRQRLENYRKACKNGEKAFGEGNYHKAKGYYSHALRLASKSERKEINAQLMKIQRGIQTDSEDNKGRLEKFEKFSQKFRKLSDAGNMEAAVKLCIIFIDGNTLSIARKNYERLKSDLPKMIFAYRGLQNIIEQGIELEGATWKVVKFSFEKVVLKTARGKGLTVPFRVLRLRDRLEGIGLRSRRKFWKGLGLIYFYRNDWQNSLDYFRLAQNVGGKVFLYIRIINEKKDGAERKTQKYKQENRRPSQQNLWQHRFSKMLRKQDLDRDNKIGWEEWHGSLAQFDLLDTNQDGYISYEDER